MEGLALVDTSIQEISEISKDFKFDCETQGLADSTIEHYQSIVAQYLRWSVDEQSDYTSVDKYQLRAYINHLRNEKHYRFKTIDNHFAGLSTFYEFLLFEEKVVVNLVPTIRKRYLRRYKAQDPPTERQVISVEQMRNFIKFIMDWRDKAVVLLLAKTGIRRGELITIDLDDINWDNNSIKLKPKVKRTNRRIFFDEETCEVLEVWLERRANMVARSKALFIGVQGRRLNRHGIGDLVVKWATAFGIHKPDSDRLEEHFTPHCCRHWFTTHLRKAGMPREFIQELRGDARREAIDIYDHIDHEELQGEYLAKVPQLGI